MRALVFTFILVLATPHASPAQYAQAVTTAKQAANSASRAAAKTDSTAKPAPAKPVAKAAAAKDAPAKDAPAKDAAKPAGDAPAPVVATPADASASPALEARGFTYTPEGRRDPFVNLLRRGTGVDLTATAGPRPTGIKGLGTGEVTLKGTMASKGAYVAILQGSDSRTYVVHPGQKLYDGTVRSITADSLVILQQVNDPLSKETQREVRKVLRQTEEAK
jgi:Tfp pilus assembly protein PilP